MATANSTGEGRQPTATFQELVCSSALRDKTHIHLIYLSAFNIFLSVTAFLGNTLILVAFYKESSLHPPSKLLFRCLATSDLCVGLVVQPLSVIYWMSLVKKEWNICWHAFISSVITSFSLSMISLLTITAISVDRLLALSLGLRYKQVVTLKRTKMAVITFWVMSSIAAMLYLKNFLIAYWYGRIVILFCLVTSVFSYTKIFLTLRRRRTQACDNAQQEQPSQPTPLNIARYRKAVYSALWVQLALVVFYLPYGVVVALGRANSGGQPSSRFAALAITSTLVYCNSSLNPFLYCWKITEVRQAVKETIKEILCCS